MKRALVFLMMLAAFAAMYGRDAAPDTVYVERGTVVIFTDSLAEGMNFPAGPRADGSFRCVMPPRYPDVKRTPKPRVPVQFAWGADIGPAIDLSGNDMSSIDFDLVVGMRRGWINFLGLGAQANMAISNSCRSYPLYVMFRTGFRDRPTRLFWEVKGGVSLNYLEHNHHQAGIYASTGFGIRLAESSLFSSHMVIGYSYLQRKRVVGAEMTHEFTDLHFASVKIGVVF